MLRILLIIVFSPFQPSVGANAANGGERNWSLERYKHTLSSAAALDDTL